MKQVIAILLLCFLIMALGCSRGPIPIKEDLIIDTFIAPAVAIPDSILSSEPIVFVRSFSHSSSGAKDLDLFLENKLVDAKHRLSSRSLGAEIKIVAQLVYLGDVAGMSVEKTLQAGFGGEAFNGPDPRRNSQTYSRIALVDLEVKTGAGMKQGKQRSRIVACARHPMPVMSPEDVRAALLEQVASQISVIFEF